MSIREATPHDYDQIWEIFKNVIISGDTYVFDPETRKEDLAKHWFAPYMKTYIAEENREIVGTYIIKPNQIDLGAHVANCGYMVSPKHRGKGIGSHLCAHSLEIAAKLGYKAMQFNLVVSTNTVAVELWKKFGFSIVGTLPKAYNHRELGYVDAFVMFKTL